jgi:pimeloyl-ACP methyl ester carboxylesterase
MFFNINIYNKYFLISSLILSTSVFYYYYYYGNNNIIIDKLNDYTEKHILSQSSLSTPVQHLSTYQQMINQAGYYFEEHKIRTEDGYILTAWRIPCLLNETNMDLYKKRKPVILQHGLIDSSYTWLLLDKEHSLPFLLVDNKFDVWLTNTRGNAVSFEHENPKEFDSAKIDSKYWNFSFHEMAVYDLPANVDYIKEKTGFEKVDYICHSQGGLIYFIMYTMNQKFIEDNFDHFISLGTVITTFTSESNLIKLGSYSKFPEIVDTLHINNILCFNKFFYDAISNFCKFFNRPCYNIVKFIVSNNFETKRINMSKLFSEFLYVPAGTSSKNLRHWMQIYNTKRLARYDYGEKKNLEIYKTKKSPIYDLSKFKNYKIKSRLYTSDKDPFSNIDDLHHLTKYLNDKYVKIKRMINYNHMDFLWSDDAKEDIYLPIINFLKYDK